MSGIVFSIQSLNNFWMLSIRKSSIGVVRGFFFFRPGSVIFPGRNQLPFSQVCCLTLLSLVSPPSENWAHTLRHFPSPLNSSSHPATVFSSSDCSKGQFSLRYSKPSDCITAASQNKVRNDMRVNCYTSEVLA